MKHKDSKFKKAYFETIRMDKTKHHDCMVNGLKKPNEKALERFRRPAYSGLFSSSKGSGGEEQ